jgi:hypothetical protein
MSATHKAGAKNPVVNRAAEIRRNWSPIEKLRRQGLPPDMPQRLEEFLLGSRATILCFASGGANAGQRGSR